MSSAKISSLSRTVPRMPGSRWVESAHRIEDVRGADRAALAGGKGLFLASIAVAKTDANTCRGSMFDEFQERQESPAQA